MKNLTLFPLALGLIFALGIAPCRGTENSTNPEPEDPSGNAGTVKSTVETGGSYNAYNGNASRSITDLQVPGVPGVYGLDFTRHWNSTDPAFSPFGSPGPRPFGNGGWTHSWNWSAAPDIKTLYCDGEGDPCHGGYYFTNIHIINIEYPDGRTARFSFSRTNLDSPDGSPEPYPPTMPAAISVDDHLAGMDPTGDFFWLYTADGGSVFFRWFDSGYRATQVVDPHGLSTYLTYENNGHGDRLTRVAGPDGRSLFLEYGALGDNPEAVIRKVGWGVTLGSYLQTVEYDYSNYSIANPANPSQTFTWSALTGVRYMDDINAGQLVQATYTYTPVATHDTDDTPGTPSPQGRGALLTTADDPRFEGAMTRIRYVFRGGPGGDPFCQSVDPIPAPGNIGPSMMYAPFPVQKEVSLDTGAVVSELYIPCNGMPDTGMRIETRGAGGARMFQFGKKGGLEPGTQYEELPNGGDRWIPPEADPGSGAWGYNAGFEITRLTDFADNPNPAAIPTDFHHNFRVKPWRSFDARGILTQYKYQTGLDFTGPSGNGRIKEVWHRHPGDGTKRTYHWDNPSGLRDTIRIPNTYHHWLFGQTDERNNTTTYTRDSLMRVTQITYYDAEGNQVAFESFTYNGFNQVTSHRLPSGAVKYFDYNGSFLWREWNTVDTIAEATIYTPDNFGRVATALNPRAAAAGAPYSAMMEYNSRHQVTKVHYPSTGGNADPTVIYEYDKYGNCTAITNELGYRSTYTYDSYRRCLSYTEPVNAPACGGSSVGSRTWNWLYDRIAEDGPKDASTHTSKKWRLQTEPVFNAAGHRRFTARDYDYNDRLNFEFVGAILLPDDGGWDLTQGAMHRYEYDANGNKKQYTDPDGRVTTYEYDNRNRVIRTNETINRVPRTTTTDYDPTGNKIQVTFPDTRTQRWVAHDPFGQPAQFFDERNNPTDLTYQWGPMKKLDQVRTYRLKDGGGTETQLTDFEYDGLGRPKQTLFHDGSKEVSTYQLGQLKSWKTRDEKVKTITSYDARGREQAHLWSDGTPGIIRVWDDAGRLLSLANSVSAIDYTYDQAGQVRAEGTTVAGSTGQAASGRKEVSYCRYPSGEVSQVTYPNGFTVQRNYTPRGQLEGVGWGSGSTSYVYRSDGKVDYQAFTNGVTTTYGYNGRGFIQSVAHRHGSDNLSRRDYWRDNRDRIEAWKRDTQNSVNGMEDGRGDRYGYDEEGQLTHASYRALNPETGSPDDVKRGDMFQYDALGNRMGSDNQVASRGPMEFFRRNNGLNQYTAWMPYSYVYYDDGIPADWTPPGNGNLMQDGWITASFNSLNQPVAMWSPIYPGGGSPHYLWFGYDPLGRCVKRWMGTGTGTPVGANPFTYLYYDGWNLVQEGTAANSPTRLYVHGGRVDEVVASYVVSSNQWAYHHYDARGHCTLLTDMAGGIREQYEYDAFGLTYFHSASGARLGSALHWGNRFLFTGREWLKDLRIYDYRHRHYQPELGRFLQPDPRQFEAGDYNLYRYCHNDPVNRTDPFGLLERDAEGHIIEKFVSYDQSRHNSEGSDVARVLLKADNGTPIKASINLTDDKTLDANCHGVTFGDGKFWINPGEVPKILNGDGYSSVTNPKIGDVALYKNEANVAVHSVTVSGKDKDGNLLGTGKAGISSEGITTKPIGPGPGAAWKDAKTRVEYYRKGK